MDISEPEDYGMMDEDDCMYDDYYDDDDDGNNNDDEYEYEGMDSTAYDQFLAAKFDGMDLPPGVEATVPWLATKEEPERPQPEMPVSYRPKNEIEHVIERKFKAFKQFDTVPDFPDHEFRKNDVGRKVQLYCIC